jgi:hypothetical protein
MGMKLDKAGENIRSLKVNDAFPSPVTLILKKNLSLPDDQVPAFY